jgi:hypothetical protein
MSVSSQSPSLEEAQDKMRPAFEHWFSDGGEYPQACQRGRHGEYLLAQACSAWQAWRAASTAREAEVKRLRDALEHARSYLLPRVRNTGGIGETHLLPVIEEALKE